MKKYFQQLLDKWLCLHGWEEFERNRRYNHPDDKMPYATRVTFICKKCGKIKQIYL